MPTVEATLDRFERGQAVLRFADGQELIISKKSLPKKIKEGSVLHLEFFRAEDAEQRKEQMARYLLKEILGSHEQ